MPAAVDRLPLNALRVFEAVATRLNFSEAADALHVTPAAVSQHIRSLEEYLQVPLFTRRGRRVQLTAEGLELLPSVRRGLAELSASLHQLKTHRSGGPLQITMLSSFLQSWLLPRMRAFHRRCPEVEIRYMTSRELVDFARSPVHVAIRLGQGNYPGLHSEKLLDEWLVPVASPELLRRHGPIRRGARLDDYPLLHSDSEPWSAWSEAAAGDRLVASAATIDDSVGILAAAEEGMGYALARWSLAMRPLQKGVLRLAGPEYLPYDSAYHFVCPKPYLGPAEGHRIPGLDTGHRATLSRARGLAETPETRALVTAIGVAGGARQRTPSPAATP